MLSTGYVIAHDDGSPGDRSVARSSIFANPELVFGFELSEQVMIGAHIGPFWSLQARHDDRTLGAGWLTSGVFLSYAFGRACDEEGYPVRTEPRDEVASY
jgi:hypothetical protein